MAVTTKTAALRFVNRIRRERGYAPLKDLRKGIKANAFKCPIAVSLHDCFDGKLTAFDKIIVVKKNEMTYLRELPPKAREFVREFDQEMWPEYVSAVRS